MPACIQCGQARGQWTILLAGPVCGSCRAHGGYQPMLGHRLPQDPEVAIPLANMVEELRSLSTRPDFHRTAPGPMAAILGILAIWDARMTTPDTTDTQAHLLGLLQALGGRWGP